MTMEEQTNYFPQSENYTNIHIADKKCTKLLSWTIAIDILFFTWIWFIIYVWFLIYILINKQKIEQECFKKIIKILFIPPKILIIILILLLISVWWCFLIIGVNI